MIKNLEKALEESKKEYDVVYAGLTGSRCVTNRDSDWDLLVCTRLKPEVPMLVRDEGVNQLVLNEEWLHYKAHEEKPVGLVPSILFKTLEFSKPLFGERPKTDEIVVQNIDFVNCGMKMERFKHANKKEVLVARIMYELLKQKRVYDYCFDNIKLAKTLGLENIAAELEEHYSKKSGGEQEWKTIKERE